MSSIKSYYFDFNRCLNVLKGILSKVVKENGHIDVLCNNAGIGDESDISKLININLVGRNSVISDVIS